jgi:hypothetical protein
LFSILALVGSPSTPAQTMEITPFVGYRLGGEIEDAATSSDLDVDESSSYGLIFNYALDPNGQIEIILGRQETTLVDDDDLFLGTPILDLDVDYYHFGGLYQWDGKKARPFITGSLGVTHMSPARPGFDSETRFSVGLGFGAKLFAGEHVGFRFEGRGFATLMDSGGTIFCSNGSCLVEIEGDLLWQFEARAGLILAF